jgi:hypothetical protein
MTRTPAEALFDTVEWTEAAPPDGPPDGIPYATHIGVLRLAGVDLDVARLSDGQAVITQESMLRFLGLLGLEAP